MPFVFAGGGVYSDAIKELADQYENVSYLGVLTAHEAASLLHQYNFGLMPIEDEVTKYAFPSKSSSYIFSGCQVIAVCGKDTSVAHWVDNHKLGYVAEPNIESLVALFHRLEKSPLSALNLNDELLKELTPRYHADSLESIIMQRA